MCFYDDNREKGVHVVNATSWCYRNRGLSLLVRWWRKWTCTPNNSNSSPHNLELGSYFWSFSSLNENHLAHLFFPTSWSYVGSHSCVHCAPSTYARPAEWIYKSLKVWWHRESSEVHQLTAKRRWMFFGPDSGNTMDEVGAASGQSNSQLVGAVLPKFVAGWVGQESKSSTSPKISLEHLINRIPKNL